MRSRCPRCVGQDLDVTFHRITEHDMLVTLATMALKMDDLTGHDVLEALKDLGHAGVIREARDDTGNTK